MIRVFVCVVTLVFAAVAPDALAARACPDTPGASCKGDFGGWWPDDDDIMRVGAGTGTATVCRHQHSVPFGSYCYQLSSTCVPDVPIPMRRHPNASRDGWGSVLRKVDRGGWCVDVCAVVDVPPWGSWIKVEGTEFVTRIVIPHDVDDPHDDEIEETTCWQVEAFCDEPVTSVPACGGGPYCFQPSPRTRIVCGGGRRTLANPPEDDEDGDEDEDEDEDDDCTPATYASVDWTPETCTDGETQTENVSCSAGTGSCPEAECQERPPNTRECPPAGCVNPPSCGSSTGSCSPGTASSVTTMDSVGMTTDSWSCASSDPACTPESCSVSTGCSSWSEEANETCICNGTTEECTRTRACSDGTCPRTGTCPTQFPIETTTTTPDSPNCQPGGPQCGLSPGTCIQGSPSGTTVDPCTAPTVSAWSPWTLDGTCPWATTESRSRACADGSPSSGQATWTCSHNGSTTSCSGRGAAPSCDWVCYGVPLSESRPYENCEMS